MSTQSTVYKKKTTVLHIIAAPKIGGAERLLLAFARTIDRKRFDMVLGIFISPGEDDQVFWNEAKKLGVPLEPVVIRSAFDPNQLRCLYGIVRKHRPDVIHCHGYKTNLLGFLFARLSAARIVTTVHGWLHAERAVTRFLDRLNLLCMRWFDRVIAVSDQVCARLVQRGVGPDNITVIRNIPALPDSTSGKTTTMAAELGVGAGMILIGFIGRLEKVKGGRQFIEAALLLLQRRDDLHFIVIGEGSEQTFLEETVRQSGRAQHFHFTGFLVDPSPLFSTLDLYVLSSLDEGIPLTLLEAMSLGIPVIATSVGGVPEVISDGVNGILVPPDDPAAIVEAVMHVLGDRPAREWMIKQAKCDIAEKYSIGVWSNRIESLYEKCLQGS